MKLSYRLLLLFAFISCLRVQAATENIIIVTVDGVRWQELFKGMDSVLAHDEKYCYYPERMEKDYGGKDAIERRKKLMPFLWSTIESHGQIFGNRDYGNAVNCANPGAFSYAGYHELFAGFVDKTITTNEHGINSHMTVLEFLNQQKKFHNSVAIFGSWTVYADIFATQRSNIKFVGPRQTEPTSSPNINTIRTLLSDEIKLWDSTECSDVFIHHQAMDYLMHAKPRVLYIAYGDTDNWSHDGKYACYLDAIHMTDVWLNKLWHVITTDPHYKNNTTLLITTDHGRGSHHNEWTEHDSDIVGSHDIWLAIVGPGISPRGEIKEPMQLYQKQVAQTIAQVLGENFVAAHEIAPALTIK